MNADRAARYRGEPPAMVPVVDPDPLAVSALPTLDSWEWFSEAGKGRAPSWKNEVTLRSVEMLMEYEPSVYLASGAGGDQDGGRGRWHRPDLGA